MNITLVNEIVVSNIWRKEDNADEIEAHSRSRMFSVWMTSAMLQILVIDLTSLDDCCRFGCLMMATCYGRRLESMVGTRCRRILVRWRLLAHLCHRTGNSSSGASGTGDSFRDNGLREGATGRNAAYDDGVVQSHPLLAFHHPPKCSLLQGAYHPLLILSSFLQHSHPPPCNSQRVMEPRRNLTSDTRS